ncbi:MAG: hypothetical protein WDZ62_00835 [Candidatus Pacearchaeota archaeon]
MKLKFEKGKQREFIDLVLEATACPTLRELINRGINVGYSSLKNYYVERRKIPLNLFEVLCKISNLNESHFSFEEVPENWGQVKGGKNSKR